MSKQKINSNYSRGQAVPTISIAEMPNFNDHREKSPEFFDEQDNPFDMFNQMTVKSINGFKEIISTLRPQEKKNYKKSDERYNIYANRYRVGIIRPTLLL